MNLQRAFRAAILAASAGFLSMPSTGNAQAATTGATLPAPGPAGEIVDPRTPQAARTFRSGVRACPSGYVVIGIRADRNMLLCMPIPMNDTNFVLGSERKQGPGIGAQPAQVWPRDAADRAAAGNYNGPSLHWCGPESFLVGLDAAANIFLCNDYVPRQISTPTTRITGYAVDRAPAVTVRYDMHACPLGSMLVGYQHDQNIFLCGRPSGPPQPQGGGSTTRPAVPVSVSGDSVLATERESCSRPRVRVAGTPQIDVYSGQPAKATIPTDQERDPDEINIRWYCQGPDGDSAEWVDCPASTTILRAVKSGSDVTFSCVRRAGVPSPNRP